MSSRKRRRTLSPSAYHRRYPLFWLSSRARRNRRANIHRHRMSRLREEAELLERIQRARG